MNTSYSCDISLLFLFLIIYAFNLEQVTGVRTFLALHFDGTRVWPRKKIGQGSFLQLPTVIRSLALTGKIPLPNSRG